MKALVERQPELLDWCSTWDVMGQADAVTTFAAVGVG
jgi:hypothetical protein